MSSTICVPGISASHKTNYYFILLFFFFILLRIEIDIQSKNEKNYKISPAKLFHFPNVNWKWEENVCNKIKLFFFSLFSAVFMCRVEVAMPLVFFNRFVLVLCITCEIYTFEFNELVQLRCYVLLLKCILWDFVSHIIFYSVIWSHYFMHCNV